MSDTKRDWGTIVGWGCFLVGGGLMTGGILLEGTAPAVSSLLVNVGATIFFGPYIAVCAVYVPALFLGSVRLALLLIAGVADLAGSLARGLMGTMDRAFAFCERWVGTEEVPR